MFEESAFQVFLLREGFLSLLVGNLDDPKVLARYLEDTNGWETFLSCFGSTFEDLGDFKVYLNFG